jgi:hypothetical protein
LATIQIKSKEAIGVRDFNEFLDKLNRKYDGKWVAILEDGEIVTGNTVEESSKAAEKRGKVVFLTHASKKDRLMLV